MHLINRIIDFLNTMLWDYLLLYLLVGTGIYFTVRLRGIQFRRFRAGWRALFGGFSLRGQFGENGLSSFQALTTAIAAQVGTGNIAGAATAMVSGGPGAIFWMWVSAVFGMSTIFAEAVLAQKTRVIRNGIPFGGPAYYIRERFKGRFGRAMAGFFSVAIILALGFAGNMVQANSISVSFKTAFGMTPLLTGVLIGTVAFFIFIGGIRRIAAFTEKAVPVMALLYVLGSLTVVLLNADSIGRSFGQIFAGAFNPQAVLGGALGITVKKAMHFGVARGLFSNEAGMGSTPHAHAAADVKHPAQQGVIAMIGVFIDTFIILTMTALVILTTGTLDRALAQPAGERLTGAALAQSAYESAFGHAGTVFIAVCMLFFAFTTIVGWYYFGEINCRALFGEKAIRIYAVLVVAFVVAGALLKVNLVWDLSDLFNGMMVLPNLVALLACSRIVSDAARETGSAG